MFSKHSDSGVQFLLLEHLKDDNEIFQAPEQMYNKFNRKSSQGMSKGSESTWFGSDEFKIWKLQTQAPDKQKLFGTNI